MQVDHKGDTLQHAERLYNRDMSRARVAVEWGFENVVQYWKFLDHHKSQKILESPTGLYYINGVILTNLHTCLYGSVTGKFFHLLPPSLGCYIQMMQGVCNFEF